MTNILKIAALAALVTIPFASTADAQGVAYMRKDTQEIRVFTNDGKLFCRRVADGFEMCHGMAEQANGAWKGKGMRHPDMPGFMKFNGTVVFGEAGLSIQGCAVGICQSENWTKQ